MVLSKAILMVQLKVILMVHLKGRWTDDWIYQKEILMVDWLAA